MPGRFVLRKIFSDTAPCETCRHAERCRDENLACQAMEYFVNVGRVGPLAPRQPSAQIFERMEFPPTQLTLEERQKARSTMHALKAAAGS